MQEQLVSVIIPVYNVEPYLKKSINSVIEQTYKNIEILLVDDGSTDNSGKICDEFKCIDKRINVIHKENGGLSDARNCGLKLAKGKLITFLDSDDLVDKEMIELLVKEIDVNGVDISMCNYQLFSDESLIKKDETIDKDIIGSRECMLRYFNGSSYQCSIVTAWGKIYRKELWNDIEFPVGKLHEDEFTTHKLIYRADKIAYINRKMYYYRKNQDSIMGTKKNIKHLDILEAFDDRIDFFIKREDYEIADFFRAVYYVIGTKYFLVLDTCLSREKKEQLRQKLNVLKRYINKSEFFDSNDRSRIKRVIRKYYLKKLLRKM